MSELFLGDSEDPVPSAGLPDVGGVEDTGDMTGTGGELVNYEYKQCVIRQWYRTLLIYFVGLLAAMFCVWLLKRSCRFTWNFLGTIGWLRPFMDGMRVFVLIVTCCGRCAFDVSSCLVSCFLQVGRLCGLLPAEDVPVNNAQGVGGGGAASGGGNPAVGDSKQSGVSGSARSPGGGVSAASVGGGGSTGALGDAGGASGVESVPMQQLGSSLDRLSLGAGELAARANMPAAGVNMLAGPSGAAAVAAVRGSVIGGPVQSGGSISPRLVKIVIFQCSR